ncbi:TY-Chap domain-containing protein [Nocardia aurea]|uniref:TY-Chap N-terminal domain-containing protein n=1 Tax=Nocardia aurea TaxID=2144174 RepID=A0ABV3G308_9NOCA
MPDDWTEILEMMPYFLEPDTTDDGDIIYEFAYYQLQDPETGFFVNFTSEDKGLAITVPVPRDPIVTERTLAILHAQPENLRWTQPRRDWPEAAAEWQTGWRYFRGDPAIAASVVAVMRDGLGMTPPRLRCRAWNDRGPTDSHTHLVPQDRPTQRGLPAQSTDWNEFAQRLDWVLHTMPRYSTVVLNERGPEGGWEDGCFVQFALDGYTLISEARHLDRARLGTTEFRRRMTELGWEHDDPDISDPPNWTGPRGRSCYKPDLRDAPRRATDTFHTVFGLDSPQELEVSAGCHYPEVDMSYVATELGVARYVPDPAHYEN